MTLSLRYGLRSDVGHVREGNEDSGYASTRLVAVADGMGGAVAGEVASRTVIDRLARVDDDTVGPDVVTSLSTAVMEANDDLHGEVRRNEALAGMGTTVTALLVDGERLALVHVGDSRCYLYRAGELTQVTRDHSLVQELVDAGEITEDEASVHPKRNIITRVLDGRDDLELDVSVRSAVAGDRYLLCSDGLTSYVSITTVAEAIAVPEPQAAADRLVELALRAGGPDNVTVLVADVVDGDTGGVQPTFAGAAAEEREGPRSDDPAASSAGRAAALSRQLRGRALRRRGEEEEVRVPVRRRSRWLVPGVALGIVVVLALGVLGGWLYVRTQYYVAPSDGHIAIYRGVPGSVGPVKLSSVVETGPPMTSLSAEAQRQVSMRITASSRANAEEIVREAEAGALPNEPSSPTPTPSSPAPSTTPPSSSPPATASGFPSRSTAPTVGGVS